MSDNFIDKNIANRAVSTIGIQLYEEYGRRSAADSISASSDELQMQYDHMYATNHNEENGLSLLVDDSQHHHHHNHHQDDDEDHDSDSNSAQPPSCQSAESEVNFIKDFLLIHLDLIQQQNDDIINKESSIFLLQQENQQLREQIKLLEAQLNERSNPSVDTSHQTPEAHTAEDMVIDSTTIVVEQVPIVQPASNILVVGVPEEEPAEGVSGLVEASPAEEEAQQEQEEVQSPLSTVIKTELPDHDEDFLNCDYTASSYTIHSTGSDQMKNLKMSIRRKRLCSNSSALSNNGSTSDEKKNCRHSRKKRKRIVKNDEILTYSEEYVTQIGDVHLMDIIRRQELAEEAARANETNLEVPRWRVKVYTSCYSLEGTENLDDEVFLRRHSRMENDEKRRKRWDVQRIREQRVIEKLKQRQDKIESNNKGVSEEVEIVSSLWPSADDIRFIEICDNLPVSAFGAPMPKIQPSVFSLPWLNNPNIQKALRRSGSTGNSRRRRRSSKR